jgi:hypothetical protein
MQIAADLQLHPCAHLAHGQALLYQAVFLLNFKLHSLPLLLVSNICLHDIVHNISACTEALRAMHALHAFMTPSEADDVGVVLRIPAAKLISAADN